MPSDLRYVDPATLRVPPSRSTGADPFKLQQQIARFGASAVGMPPIWAYECPDGSLLIVDGVTRATRIAKLAPDTQVPVEVIGRSSGRAPIENWETFFHERQSITRVGTSAYRTARLVPRHAFRSTGGDSRSPGRGHGRALLVGHCGRRVARGC